MTDICGRLKDTWSNVTSQNSIHQYKYIYQFKCVIWGLFPMEMFVKFIEKVWIIFLNKMKYVIRQSELEDGATWSEHKIKRAKAKS